MRCNERTIENHEREERSLLNYSPFLLYSTLLLYSLENSVPLSEMKMAENREKEREELLFHPNPCCSVLFCSSFHCSSSCYNCFLKINPKMNMRNIAVEKRSVFIDFV